MSVIRENENLGEMNVIDRQGHATPLKIQVHTMESHPVPDIYI